MGDQLRGGCRRGQGLQVWPESVGTGTRTISAGQARSRAARCPCPPCPVAGQGGRHPQPTVQQQHAVVELGEGGAVAHTHKRHACTGVGVVALLECRLVR